MENTITALPSLSVPVMGQRVKFSNSQCAIMG